MYGQCKICGKKHGTIDGENFFEPCVHIITKHYINNRIAELTTGLKKYNPNKLTYTDRGHRHWNYIAPELLKELTTIRDLLGDD